MKVYLKALVLGFTLSLVTAVSVLAQEGENFGKRKAEAVSELDERIAKLQAHRGCMNSAADQAAMTKCRESMGDWRKGERMERMDKRMEHMDKRKARMEERKKMLEGKKN